MEENKTPIYERKRIDVKHQAIEFFKKMINDINNRNGEKILGLDTKVLILTTIGQIHGNILTVFDKSEDEQMDIAKNLNTELLKLKSNALSITEKLIKTKPDIVNNSDIITIVDATLIPYSSPDYVRKYKILNIFADQIVGFSFGELSS